VRLDSALHSFEDLKTSLQNVTLRYSEIGELKKNHLVLRDMVESLQVASEAYKRDSVSGNAGRLLELEKEVSALKAELRNAYEHLELLEARSSQAAPAPELPPIKEIETLRGELAALENVRTEDRQRWQAMEDKLADMSVRPHNGSDHPVSTDMYDIRKNLDEIRGFMAHLSRKL
jgi:predicted  nucleic acid-binding Zn-ribbon protein